MAGCFFPVLAAGGRLPIRHGVGGFTTEFIYSSLSCQMAGPSAVTFPGNATTFGNF
jgi:hypothetical protein